MTVKFKPMLHYQLLVIRNIVLGGVLGWGLLGIIVPSLFDSYTDSEYSNLMIGVVTVLTGGLLVSSGTNFAFQHSVSRKTLFRVTILAILVSTLIWTIVASVLPLVIKAAGGDASILFGIYVKHIDGITATAITTSLLFITLLTAALVGGIIGVLLLNASRKQAVTWGIITYVLIMIITGFAVLFFNGPTTSPTVKAIHTLVGLPIGHDPDPIMPLIAILIVMTIVCIGLKTFIAHIEQPKVRRG